MRNSPQRVDFKFWVFNFSLRDQMGEWWFRVLFVGCLVFGVNGYPKEDLVESLPGQPKVGFSQYAGYVDVDLKNGRSLFYYFVEAEKDPDHMPLTLWLNGGPGCSSVGGGAFTELGPFYPKGDGRGLGRNSMSWNKASNLLFVESPAGVGWSYSNTSSDYNSGDESTARDMLTFMLKWFEKFPAFKSRDLFLTGESYAGHYVPQLAVAMLEYNAHSTGFKFNIKGIAIGNPLLKLDRDVPSTYEFLWSHGMISDEIGLAIMKDCDFEDYTFSSPHNTTDSCNNAIEEANRIVGDYINSYDVILDVCYPSIVQQELRLRKLATKISVGIDVCMSYERRFYFNLPEVQKSLHANRTNLPYSWSMCSNVLNYSNTDANIDILPLLKRIIQNHIPVWIFSGDQDSVVPLLGSRTLVRELAHDLHFKVTVPYGAWFHKHQNESQVSGNVEALYKQHNQRLTTNKHPQTQPSSPVQKLQRFSFQNIQMASPVTDFPHFLPPPPPAAIPPSSPPRPRPPPPPPHILPPPPPPHITPPPPDNGHTVIVIVFISFGGLFLLAFFAIALFCFIKKTKKKKKMVQETNIIHVDEHLKVKKGIVQGPHGAEAVVLSVEDDVHVEEEIKKNENFVEGKHVKSTDNISSALEEGTSSSSSAQHHSLKHKP